MGKNYEDSWEKIHKLGSGGQGEVWLSYKRSSIDPWYQRFRQGIQSFSSNISNHGGPKEIEQWFQELMRRVKGEIPSDGALKILHNPKEAGQEDKQAKERMRLEIDALAKVNHKNIIKILDHDDEPVWYVSGFFPEGNLSDEKNRKIFKANPTKSLRAFIGLVQGVAELHSKKLIHRDIKPANIFCRDSQLILGDFGLVFFSDDQHTRITESMEKVGTSDWMPTWTQGRYRVEDVKASFDVFSLGKILWCLISGKSFLRLHYYTQPEFDLCKQYPSDTRMKLVNEMLLSKCLVEHEADCLQSAKELLECCMKLQERLNAEKRRKCAVCGVGKYVGDVGCTVGKSECYHLYCDHCGYRVSFNANNGYEIPKWVKVLKNEKDILN